ncbi:MAG: hypothetical protein DMF50_12285 [Acidobacteria bacterium]|nr:MAG: hypothetical protein DMF50_12285 [Acidobacteriota bacterium]
MVRKAVVILGAWLFLFAFLFFLGGAAPPPPQPAPPAPPAPPTPEAEESGRTFFFNSGGSWLGVSIADIGADRARELKLKEERGAEVQSVMPDSPAAEAGLKEKDAILEYQGTRVEGVAQLTRLVGETPAGRTVDLVIWRDGGTRQVKVKMTEREPYFGHGGHFFHRRIEIPPIEIPDIDIPDIPDLESIPSSVRLGVQIENLNEQLGEYFGVKDGEGVLVRSVSKGSPGESAGLRAGDIIVKMAGEAISDASDLRSALRDNRGKQVAITIVREKREQNLSVTLPKKEDRSSGKAAGAPGRRQDLRLKLDKAQKLADKAGKMDDARVLRLEMRRNLQGPRPVI